MVNRSSVNFLKRLAGKSKREKGFALVTVLLVAAVVSFIGLVFIAYGRWQNRLAGYRFRRYKLNQAYRYLEAELLSRLHKKLKEQGGTVTEPPEITRKLPPGIETRGTVKVLNGKINLNLLNWAGVAGKIRPVVEKLFVTLGYPRRGVDEIVNWIEPAGELGADRASKYSSYGYSSPGRRLYQLDELELISGFRQVGINFAFRRIFTVHGSGNLNLLHLERTHWRLLRNVFPRRLPSAPAGAFQDREKLKKFLKQEQVWKRIKNKLPVVQLRDDSFYLDFELQAAGVKRRLRTVYRYHHKQDKFELISRFYQLTG